ncbi:MAG: Mur ligase family protein [Thermoplasmata archaeon]
MKYDEFLKWLYTSSHRKIKVGLERITHLLDLLGNPQKGFKTIHITGSKGKGSVASIIYTILYTNGYRTGLYTSPHLERYTERFVINGKEIDKKVLCNIGEEIIDIIESNDWDKYGGTPTFFEITTAIAFKYFFLEKVDIGVIEVGIGGRLDSTNVIIPLSSIITNIDLEHTEILGDTLSKIAFEKGGIIKNGVPVFVGEIKKEPLNVLENIANEKNAPLYRLGREIKIADVKTSLEGTFFNLKTPFTEQSNLFVPLLGDFQANNAGIAVSAVRYLSKRGFFDISENNIMASLQKVKWAGRFEIIRKEPYIIIDGAHTIESSKVLANNINHLFNNSEFTIIFGIMKDKKVDEIISNISKIPSRLIITKIDYHRSMDTENVKKIAIKYYDPSKLILAESVEKSIETALKYGDPILITGSIYLIGEARSIILNSETDPVKMIEGNYSINWENLLEKLYKFYNYEGYQEPYLVTHNEDPFKVLICTMVSQRTKDETTDHVCKKLFDRYKNIDELSKATVKDLEQLLKPAGFYRQKAKKIKEVALIIKNRYNGIVPNSMEDLLLLPGVGRKTAGCVITYAYNGDELPVDIHVHRISNRLGVVYSKTPEETEHQLKKIIPKNLWKYINHIFVKHGQNICRPVSPKCDLCPISMDCLYFSSLNSR